MLLSAWKRLLVELNDLKLKLKSDSPIAFNFVEGIACIVVILISLSVALPPEIFYWGTATPSLIT